MTTIGLIADIHANLVALQRGLDLLRTHQPDVILCAGDLVEKGAEGDAVVEQIRSLAIPCVMGNHDFDTIGNQAWLRANADLSHPAMQGRLLKDETLAYLKALPKSLDFTWDEKRVVLSHGAPWSNSEYIFPNSSARIFERIVQETHSPDIVILGHTHIPMCIQVNTTRIINPGAVCGNYPGGKGSFAVLTLPDFRFQIYGIDDGSLLNEYA